MSVVVIGVNAPSTRTVTEEGLVPDRSETVTLNVNVVAVVPPEGDTVPLSIEIWPQVLASTGAARAKAHMTSQPVIARAPTGEDLVLVPIGPAITNSASFPDDTVGG